MNRSTKYFYILTAHLFFFIKIDALYCWHFFLKSETMLVDSQVRIGDIGNILGNDITKEQKTKLLTTVLTGSPILESSWDIQIVRDLLDKNSIYPESIRGKSIRLIVPVEKYEAQEINALIFSAYKDKGFSNEEFKVEVKRDMLLPAGNEYKIVIDGSKTPGEKSAAFVYQPTSIPEKSAKPIPGYKSRQIQIPYVLKMKRSFIKTIEPIKTGERLSSQNAEITTEWIDFTTNSALATQSGYIATRYLDKGILITSDCVKKITDVKRGDSVTVIYLQNNLIIESDTSAMEQGSVGQTLKFKTRSNRIIFGKLTSATKAEFSSNAGIK